MKKYAAFIILIFMAVAGGAKAQVFIGGGGYYRPYPPPRRRPVYQQQQRRPPPPFTPSVNINLGYGFPNLDKNQMANFYNDYKGNVSTQTGPFLGSIDYQFSRYMSIGALGTYGKVDVPYYSYSSPSSVPDFTGHIESWSLMLNIMNYIPVYDTHVVPYFRTAIGVNNILNETYEDASGNKIAANDNSTQLAYQVSFGARFKLSPNAGLFIEAGYGKYIAAAGLSFKF